MTKSVCEFPEPEALPGCDGPEEECFGEHLLHLLSEKDVSLGEHRRDDPEEALVDSKSLSRDEPDRTGEDLTETLRRLADHYRSVHQEREGETSRIEICRCPGYGPNRQRSRDRLRRVMRVALSAEKLPGLSEIIRAVRGLPSRFDLVA